MRIHVKVRDRECEKNAKKRRKLEKKKMLDKGGDWKTRERLEKGEG